MESINFVLDIIVTHLESPEIQDFSAVQVSAVFGNVKVNLSASSINVTEFKAGAGVNLKASPKKFRKSLEDCGLALTVSYKTKAIGVGQILLPQNTIDMIEAGMSDLMYTGSCSFEREGEYVGKLEVLCRLIIKCDELPNQVEPACVSNVDKAINRQDIMFVLSESQRCPNFCDPCQEALEADEGNEMLKLDLGRYHSPAGKGQRLSEIFKHNPTANNACCQLKEMADECEQIVDSITNRIGQPKDIKSPCRVPEGPELDGICNIPNQYFQDSIGLTSLGPCFSYIPAREGEGPDFCDPALIPAPISDLNKPFVKPPRFCPICLTNMSWLPKLASCPKCGAKAMPVIEERHKEKKLTPDQIIQEFLGKTTNPERCEDPCEKAERERNDEGECANRCACECGKFCAHCRIRQLCADIFKASKNEMECPKVMPKSSEDFCVKDENSQDCKPYLARVFSELRDLYEIKDTLRINNCGQKNDPKEIYPPEKSTKPVKSSKCNKPIKRNPPISSGLHKNCVKSEGAVARNRGWAWDLREEAWKYGWRPGFVKKSVKRVMKFFLRYSPDDTAFNTCDTVEETAMKEQQDQPTLNVCKKNGEIIVTLQPINNGAAQMEPIVFRVVKSDLAVALSAIKRKLKAKGFPKCTCHNTVMMCVCRDIIEKKHLEMAIEKESKRWGMESCVNDLVLTDTSDSEVEYDFNVSPPAASASPRVKRTTLNNGTQTVKKDLVVPSKYPMKLGSYWRAYDCAAGDRYTGTAFGNPGEAVFEDGLFGHGGGGPHGASAAPGGRPKIPGIWGSGQGGPMRGGGRSGGPGGMGGPGGAGGGGPGGLSALFKDKSFPGNKNQQGKGKSAPIPVRMPKRHYEKLKNAAKAEKEAKLREIANKKKGVNLMNYLMKDGAIPTPWDPNNPKPAKTAKQMLKEEEEKKERLQAGERKRRELLGMAIPPLESMPRLGRGYDPCQCCYNPCAAQCCYPCWYN